MNLSVKGFLLPSSFPSVKGVLPHSPSTHTIPAVSRPCPGLVSLPTSLVPLSCWLFSYWFLQYLQRQNKARAIDPPHLPRRFSVYAAVTGPLPALMFETLLWALAGSRSSMELFPFSVWERMKSYRWLLPLSASIPLPTLGRETGGRPNREAQ